MTTIRHVSPRSFKQKMPLLTTMMADCYIIDITEMARDNDPRGRSNCTFCGHDLRSTDQERSYFVVRYRPVSPTPGFSGSEREMGLCRSCACDYVKEGEL